MWLILGSFVGIVALLLIIAWIKERVRIITCNIFPLSRKQKRKKIIIVLIQRGANEPPIVGGPLPFFGCIVPFASDSIGLLHDSYKKVTS